MSALSVTGHDNRGTEEVPWGFVYFNDGTRVVYSHKGVTQGTGGWEEITHTHRIKAWEYLVRNNVNFAEGVDAPE